MPKFPPPPEPPTASSNYLEELELYYQRLKEYGLKISKMADTQLGYVKALLNPKFADLEEESIQVEDNSATTGSSAIELDNRGNHNDELDDGASSKSLKLLGVKEEPGSKLPLNEEHPPSNALALLNTVTLEQPLLLETATVPPLASQFTTTVQALPQGNRI